MARKRLDQLGSLQRRVMDVLWDRREGTVAQVREALTALDNRSPAYTTVLSVLQKLSQGGWVQHRKDGRTYVYRPARSREEAGATSVRTFVQSVFMGDPMEVFQTLLEDESLDTAQLDELRTLIERKRRETEGGGAS